MFSIPKSIELLSCIFARAISFSVSPFLTSSSEFFCDGRKRSFQIAPARIDVYPESAVCLVCGAGRIYVINEPLSFAQTLEQTRAHSSTEAERYHVLHGNIRVVVRHGRKSDREMTCSKPFCKPRIRHPPPPRGTFLHTFRRRTAEERISQREPPRLRGVCCRSRIPRYCPAYTFSSHNRGRPAPVKRITFSFGPSMVFERSVPR